MAADASAAGSRVHVQERNPNGSRAGSVKGLLAGSHGPGQPLFHALALRSRDYEYFYEDFTATAITATTSIFTAGTPHTWAYAESNAGATDPAKLTPTAADSSAMSLATTANTYNQTLLGPKMYTANKYAFFEVRLKVSQVTDYAMSIGFADAIPASAASIVTDIDTPAVATVADGALYAIDISQTLKTAALVAIGTSTAVSKVNVAPTSAPFGVPTAATYFTVRVSLTGNGQTSGVSVARLWINDALVAENTGGPDGEKLLCPVLFQGSPGGTALTSTIDYLMCGQQKAGSPF